MRQWIQVNANEVNIPRWEIRNGVEVQVVVSPYDVPVAVRGGYDEVAKAFAIDFKYPSEEEEHVPKTVSDHITCFIGAKSRRLQRILIDVDKFDSDRIMLQVQGLADKFPEINQHPSRRGNIETASKLLRAKQHELFSGIGS